MWKWFEKWGVNSISSARYEFEIKLEVLKARKKLLRCYEEFERIY
jgi:hypothetical protein